VDLVGAVVRRPIAAGQPIGADSVVKPGDRGFLAAVLDPGMRAISVPIDEAAGNAGLIFPGDGSCDRPFSDYGEALVGPFSLRVRMQGEELVPCQLVDFVTPQPDVYADTGDQPIAARALVARMAL